MPSANAPIIKLKPWWLAWAWWAKNANITIYPYIYSIELPIDDIDLAHELVHWKQQKLADSRFWFLEYILFPSFRRMVELEAYTVTIRCFIEKNQWSPIVESWLIKELSGWMYFKMMCSVKARAWIDETVAIIEKEGV